MSSAFEPHFSESSPNPKASEIGVYTQSSDSSFLVLLKSPNSGVDPVEWVGKCQDEVRSLLMKYGAILMRGFQPQSAQGLDRFIKAFSGDSLEYTERTSPRSTIAGNIYTSTDYPADQEIPQHNEHSYSVSIPQKLYFMCLIPPMTGGETPLADCRRLTKLIPPSLVEKFKGKQYLYVRNFRQGFGLSWQNAFQTTNRQAVEEYCKSHKISYEWLADDALRTEQVRPLFITHPKTGEAIWCNHLVFFNVHTLPPLLREAIQDSLSSDLYPNNTYYPDHTPIETEVIDLLRQYYSETTVAFTWEKGDILILDNLLVSHGRNPYSGERRIAVGMSEELVRTDL